MRWRTANTRRKRMRYELTVGITSDDGQFIMAQRTFVRRTNARAIHAAMEWMESLRPLLSQEVGRG